MVTISNFQEAYKLNNLKYLTFKSFSPIIFSNVKKGVVVLNLFFTMTPFWFAPDAWVLKSTLDIPIYLPRNKTCPHHSFLPPNTNSGDPQSQPKSTFSIHRTLKIKNWNVCEMKLLQAVWFWSRKSSEVASKEEDSVNLKIAHSRCRNTGGLSLLSANIGG